MGANSRERAREVKRIAQDFFRRENLVKTSAQVERIAEDLSKGVRIGELRRDFNRMIDSFRKEFVQGNEFRRKSLKHIEDTIVSAILKQKRKIKSKFMELFPLLENMRKSAESIGAIGTVFLHAPRLTPKERYYCACVLYVLHVEGIFDDKMRLLYVLKKAADGQDVDLKTVGKISLSNLQGRFRRMGAGLLFDGWNRHLRNAIAHAHFGYNNKTRKMSFKDINIFTGKVSYNKNLNYKDFVEYFSKIDDVCSLIDYFFMLIRIQDLIFAPNVEV